MHIMSLCAGNIRITSMMYRRQQQRKPTKIMIAYILFFGSLLFSILEASQTDFNTDTINHNIISSSTNSRALQTYQGDLTCENGGVQGPINVDGYVFHAWMLYSS